MSGGLSAARREEQHTKSGLVQSKIKVQKSKSEHLELPFLQTSQYREAITPHHTYKHYMQQSSPQTSPALSGDNAIDPSTNHLCLDCLLSSLTASAYSHACPPPAVLGLQNIGQQTCSHISTPESICKSLPGGIVSSDQPNIEHLPELISGVREPFSDTVQYVNSHFQLQPKVVPLCLHIQKLRQQKDNVIQGQYLP